MFKRIDHIELLVLRQAQGPGHQNILARSLARGQVQAAQACHLAGEPVARHAGFAALGLAIEDDAGQAGLNLDASSCRVHRAQ